MKGVRYMKRITIMVLAVILVFAMTATALAAGVACRLNGTTATSTESGSYGLDQYVGYYGVNGLGEGSSPANVTFYVKRSYPGYGWTNAKSPVMIPDSTVNGPASGTTPASWKAALQASAQYCNAFGQVTDSY
jgi:hypothetical protein